MSSDLSKGEMVLFPAQGANLAEVNSIEEDRTYRRYLLAIRKAFQEKNEIRECLTAHSHEERRDGVLHFLLPLCIAQPGGEPLLTKAVEHLLHELEQMKLAGHSRYIIDESTGLAVAPLTANLIQKTPDFIDEGGNLRKGRQVVDPGFASALGLARQEMDRTEKALAKPGNLTASAYEHLRNPNSILELAREHMDRAGISSAVDGNAVELTLEIGVEQSDGIFQAPNAGFHRQAAYGAQLARRIIADGHKACEIVGMEKKSNSKSRWYEVRARVPERTPDPTPATP